MTMLSTLLVAMAVAAPPADSAPTPDAQDEATRQAIERSLPYLENNGVAWIEERKCASCHQIPGMLWGFNAARRQGISVDSEKLNGWTDWALDLAATNVDKNEERDGGGLDTMAQLIAGRDYENDDVKARARLLDLAGLIMAAQQEDGSWKPAGQLPGQTRPLDETTQVTTAWTALALSSIADAPADVIASRERALAFVKSAAPGHSGEWWAVMLLIAQRHGSADRVAELQQEIFALQNEDGGWSFLRPGPTSPLATGQVLYALAETGVPSDHPAIFRARKYLIDTQREDGSWATASTLKRKNGKVYPIASYWGTGWAVAGLAQTLVQ